MSKDTNPTSFIQHGRRYVTQSELTTTPLLWDSPSQSFRSKVGGFPCQWLPDGRCIAVTGVAGAIASNFDLKREATEEEIKESFKKEKVKMSRATAQDYISHALMNGNDQQRRIALIGTEVIATLLRKNADYGGSVYKSPVLAPHLAPRSAILCRLSDKIERFSNLSKQNATAQVNESIEDTMKDLVGYALLYLTCPEEKQDVKEKEI